MTAAVAFVGLVAVAVQAGAGGSDGRARNAGAWGTEPNPTLLTADRAEIPEVISQVAERAGLTGQGTPRFVALDADLREVDVARAGSAYLLYGDEATRSVKVFVGMADGDGSSRTLCSSAAPAVLACDVRDARDGDVVVRSVIAPGSLAPDAAFATPLETLTAIAESPALHWR
ncbi:hypothetical protein [Nocardioides nitrophenolicus]|uniref:hypothetical protein n=1 Tax=Nocardioides nitrophenolicus TaxID=60489 RepID=UPI001961493E|nr:hypothetical protein [Nocardioides nitrophenolicus]MBM7520401.1 hypothetical protein [Nocardioides nitrophenolicus]